MANSLTKSAVLTKVTEAAAKATGKEITKKQTAAVIAALVQLAYKEAKNKFTIPGLVKIFVVQKPAVPARKGINPFTKQEQMFKAKPARKVIKVRALKAFKDVVK